MFRVPRDMKRTLTILTFALAVAGCAGDLDDMNADQEPAMSPTETSTPTPNPTTSPEPTPTATPYPQNGAAFIQWLYDNDYTNWDRAPGYETTQPAFGPHGDVVDIYISAEVVEALDQSGLSAWPEGSIIAKDAFSSGGVLEYLAAMEKRNGAWYWVEVDGAGNIVAEGNPGICTGCHASGQDSVFAFPLP